MPWGKQNVTLFYGEVPLGESVELLVLRKAFARQLLPDGKVGGATSHPYYEVCTAPALYDLVAALIRTQQAATLASQRARRFLESPQTAPLYCSRRRKGSGDPRGLQNHSPCPSRIR